MSQLFPPEMIEGLSAYFPRSNSSTTSWGNTVSNHLLLRNLRAYWPFTSVDELGDVYDLSNQGRTLTNQNAVPFASLGVMTYASLASVSSHYFSRPTEAGLEITDELTMGGWYYIKTLAANRGLMSKWTLALDQRSYILFFDVGAGFIRFGISNLGTAASSVYVNWGSRNITNKWLHIVGRFTPSTELAIFVNGAKTTNVVGIPASIFVSTADLEIGAYDGAANFLNGDLNHNFICAATLSDAFIKALFWHSCPLFAVKP